MEEKDKMAKNLEEDKTDEVNKEQQDMVNDEKKDGKVDNEVKFINLTFNNQAL